MRVPDASKTQGRRRWSRTARILHWLSAALVLTMLGLGLIMVHRVTDIGAKFDLYQLHKSVGFTVFVATLSRLGWRLAVGRPPPPLGTPLWERRAAALVHAGLYAVLLAMPVAGWLMVSTSPIPVPTVIFDLFTLPDAPGLERGVHFETFKVVHRSLSWLLMGLLAVHVAAALKHHFLDRDDVLACMLGLAGSPASGEAARRS